MKIYYNKPNFMYCIFEDGFVENYYFKTYKRKYTYCIGYNYIFKEIDSFKIRRKMIGLMNWKESE